MKRPGLASLCIALSLLAAASQAEEKKLKVAFFGFEMINTSPAPTSEEEKVRILRIGEVLREMLNASGRYEVVTLSDALQRKIAQSSKITGCNGCEIDWAKEAGADIAAFGTVQKVSNLILNENIYMSRVDGAPFFSHSVDIRGNTDESWERGMRYMIGNYFLTTK
ncbi:MAG: DUF3280 domain-containing protein [Methylocystis sp.]|jgi:hypothetical protein